MSSQKRCLNVLPTKEEDKPKYDGCNSCSCSNGKWLCTLVGCSAELECVFTVDQSTSPLDVTATCTHENITATNLRIPIAPFIVEGDVTATLSGTDLVLEAGVNADSDFIWGLDSDQLQVGSPYSVDLAFKATLNNKERLYDSHEIAELAGDCGVGIADQEIPLLGVPNYFAEGQNIIGALVASPPVSDTCGPEAQTLLLYKDLDCPVAGDETYYYRPGMFSYHNKIFAPEQRESLEMSCYASVEAAEDAGLVPKQN